MFSLLFIDNFMTVEPLFAPDQVDVATSRSSLLLKGVLRVLWWGAWLFLALMTAAFLASILAYNGVESIKSKYFVETSPFTGVSLTLSAAVVAIVLLIIIAQLRHICGTLIKGDPFVPENAKRLRIIWVAVAVSELFRFIANLVLTSLPAKGETITGAANHDIEFTLRPYVWFFVLVLVVLAEVFREGARLRQEQKFTV